MNIKQGITQLKQDVKNWYIVIIVVFLYIVITNIIFDSACAVVIATGFPCPGCGMTRAAISFLLFRWEDAWNYNCVIFLIVPFAIYWLACRYIFQCKCREITIGLLVISLCLLGLYIYRMIHFYPEIPPMVYNENNILHFLWDMFMNAKG